MHQNPFEKKPKTQKSDLNYKSARIHPEYYEVLREMAHKHRTTLVELISVGVGLLQKEYGDK